MATRPTKRQVEARDRFAKALLAITDAVRLDGAEKFGRDDLEAIASRLARATSAFSQEAIVARAVEDRGRSLGLPTAAVEMLTLLEDVDPLETLLLTDDHFLALIDRVNEELVRRPN